MTSRKKVLKDLHMCNFCSNFGLRLIVGTLNQRTILDYNLPPKFRSRLAVHTKI